MSTYCSCTYGKKTKSLCNHSSGADPEPRPSKKRRASSISTSIPQDIAAMANETPEEKMFDPSIHLGFVPPEKVYSMAEIGRADQGVSPNAVSAPFPLFTQEAIKQMRSEILSKPVLENCQYKSNMAACQLRGFAPKYAPFTYQAWNSKEVLSIVSKIAGIDLVPVMDFEIAHVNISTTSQGSQTAAAEALAEHKRRQEDEGVSGCPWEDDTPVVDWHTDSYPFVCVLMLSNCEGMIGGETALRTGTGEIMKVRGPGMGNAVVMQGRYIEHQALRALGGTERITTVTSFRPRSPFINDDTVLTTVRAVSNLSELYGGYAEYRMKMLQERIRQQSEELQARKTAGKKFDTAGFKAFLRIQKSFVEAMLKEMVDEDKVVPGLTDTTHLISDDLRVEAQEKAKLWRDEGGIQTALVRLDAIC